MNVLKLQKIELLKGLYYFMPFVVLLGGPKIVPLVFYLGILLGCILFYKEYLNLWHIKSFRNYIFLVLWLLLSTIFFTKNSELSFKPALHVLSLSLFVGLTIIWAKSASDQTIKNFGKIFGFSGLILIVLSAFNYFCCIWTMNLSLARFEHPLYEQNSNTTIFFIGISFIAYLFSCRPMSRKSYLWLIWLAGILVFSIGFWGYLSRGAFLGLGLAALSLLVWQIKWFKWLLLGFSLFIVLILFEPSYLMDWLRRGDGGRLDIWKHAWDLIQKNWIFGQGIMSAKGPMFIEGLANHPHSLYFSVILSAGVFGIIFYILLLGRALLNAYQVMCQGSNKAQYLLFFWVWLVFGLGVGFFDLKNPINSYDVEWMLLWFPLAALIGLSANGGNPYNSNASLHQPRQPEH
jgi:O-antigen ligase